jgi:hypothetical protein
MDAPRQEFSPQQFQEEFPLSSLDGCTLEDVEQAFMATIGFSLNNYWRCIQQKQKEEAASHIDSCIKAWNEGDRLNLYDALDKYPLFRPLSNHILYLLGSLDSLVAQLSEQSAYHFKFY